MKPISIISITTIYTLLTLFHLLPQIYSQFCMPNYQFFNPVSSQCSPCPTSCLSCLDTVCTACNPQFYLSNSSQCLPCPFGCEICSSTGCQSCIAGLYLSPSFSCLPCAQGVQTCTIALVIDCKPNYFLLGGICVGCIDNCQKCQDFISCLLCDDGYYVDGNGLCAQCGPNCSVCINGACTACSRGYVISGTGCVIATGGCGNFCEKCGVNGCEQCAIGKYVDNGVCKQGGSLLCLSAVGPDYTDCQTNLYGCPYYAQVQTDIMSGTQLPVCLPLHASQNNEFIYIPYSPSCQNSSICSVSSTQSFKFTTLKPFFSLTYFISLNIYSSPLQTFTISFSSSFIIHSLNLSLEFSQLLNDSCNGCTYGHTLINGSKPIGGKAGENLLNVSGEKYFFVKEIMIQVGICKVERCSACTTAIDCVQCDHPYFLQLISCVQDCDPGFYKYGRTCVLSCPSEAYPIQSSYVCNLCVSPCLTCTSQNQCLSCIDGYFLEGTACLTNCSKPTLFTNLTSKLCQPCPNPCTQCSISISPSSSPSPSWSISCLGCAIGYLLQSSTCTYLCPTGTFSNYINNKTQCSNCQIGCASCSISSNICMSCQDGYLLDGGACTIMSQCGLGYFVGTGNVCEKCHYPCLECTGQSGNCTSCIKGALLGNTCPLVCPDGMFINYTQTSQICSQCPSPCLTCLNPSTCLSCVSPLYLSESQCVSSCPITHFPSSSPPLVCLSCIPPCLTCLSASHCLSCSTGFLSPLTNSCTLICPQSYYPDTNFTCHPCVSPCVRCYGEMECQMCALPWVLWNGSCVGVGYCENIGYVKSLYEYGNGSGVEIGRICQLCTYPCGKCRGAGIVCTDCVGNYLFVSELTICVLQCPQSYFQNQSLCQKCSSTCLSCSITASNCTKCSTSMYLYLNSCLLTCPQSFYPSSQLQSCLPCLSPCSTCLSPFLCLSCSTGIFSPSSFSCLSACPSSTLHNVTQNLCEPCLSPCLTCSVLLSNCTQCSSNNGYYLHEWTCVQICPSGYYGDDFSGKCEKCVEPCRECVSGVGCKNCVSGYFFVAGLGSGQGGKCVTVCEEGYFQDATLGVCELCNITFCRACQISANNCTLCASGYYYSSSLATCTQLCPNSTYPDLFYLECRQCPYPCQTCNSSTCFSCLGSYKLFQENCFTSCPIGYYSDSNFNNACVHCGQLCEVCENGSYCLKCVDGYFEKNGVCMQECGSGYFKGYEPVGGYAICGACPIECQNCTETFNCISCQPNYYLFNGLCLQECPTLFYPSQSPLSCQPCPQFCSSCSSSSSCLQCTNSFIYKNQCYLTCPDLTYPFNEQLCIDCVLPCLACTSEYYCQSCQNNYFLFQNYCVQKCPQDVWKYPQNGSCSGQCPYNKYQKEMLCFVGGCGGMLVGMDGYCLEECPSGYYVDQKQNCVQCGETVEGRQFCGKPFKADLQFLRSENLKACITFNEPIQYTDQNWINQKIQIHFYSKQNSASLAYPPQKIAIDQNRIIIQFGYQQLQLYSFDIKIPYFSSKWTKQSLIKNYFKGNLDFYENYQYQSQSAQRLLAQTQAQFNPIFKPNQIVNILAVVLVSCTFLLVLINIVCKGTHYRQLLDFLQFISATLYLEIQYPPILSSFLEKLKISLFSFLPRIQFTPYAFSPSKFIEYNSDCSILRSEGILLILFTVLLMLSFVLIAVQKYNKNCQKTLKSLIKRIKYRNITDIFSIMALPLLVFGIRFEKIADGIAGILVFISVSAFTIFIAYMIITAKNPQQIEAIAGQLQKTQSIIGYLYTPFAFLRKLIFSLALSLQPLRPLSSLTLLLIFTILILVCLFFYQPFQNQITDYICISMEVILVLFVGILILMGLNGVKGVSGHYAGVGAIGIGLIGGFGGLGWLAWLTYGAIRKWWRERSKEEGDEQRVQGQESGNQVQNLNNSTVKNSNKDVKQNHYDDQPSASQLIKSVNKLNRQNAKKPKLKQSQKDLSHQEQSQQNSQQFRHWNNSQSDEKSQVGNKIGKPPKYLLKKQITQQQQQRQEQEQQ